ncbi:unnamed protein product [Angiostrongylus costaricensis]|uniref:PITH domain-containing protein n=1 Tax=Angiostrongylus costaricensis TaxID=334426 RepID=A0A0R3PC29_ANGCS|nr:unnamed protein product [Angiostrongylus costaricensis]
MCQLCLSLFMPFLIFCIAVKLRMSAFFICLCPEFLGSLLQFFTVTKTQEQIDREMESLGSSGATQKLESSQTTATNSDSGVSSTALDCDMQGVEVILVENSMQPETSQALILSFNMRMEARPVLPFSESSGVINYGNEATIFLRLLAIKTYQPEEVSGSFLLTFLRLTLTFEVSL